MSHPALLAGALLLAQAYAPPPALPSDPRIRLVTYNAGQVVTLAVTPGYAAVVALGPDERAESIVVGDSTTWQVTASKRGDDVVVKPLAGATTTNMVIVTGDRHYVFQLQSGGGEGAAPYIMRFVYPDTAPVQLSAAPPVTTFRFSGDKTLFPIAMSDDGVRTTISWDKDTALPAVFAIDKDGQEAIINGRMVEGLLLVERVAERFTFRLGKAHATATRRDHGKSR